MGLRVDQDFERNHLAGVANDGPGTGGGGAPAAAGGEARYADTQTDNWSIAAGWLQGGCGADALGCDSGTVGCEQMRAVVGTGDPTVCWQATAGAAGR